MTVAQDDDPLAKPGLWSLGSLLSFVTAIGLPVLMFAASAGGLLRLTYPATSLLVAFALYRSRSPWLPGFCIWLFCLSSLVRRLADYQAGFEPSSTILLAPYLACLPTLGSALRLFVDRRDASAVPFLVVFGCYAYGTVIGIIDERLLSSLVECLKLIVGPAMAIHVLTTPSAAQNRTTLLALLAVAPAIAIYSVWQFIEPLPWDVDWLTHVISLGFTAAGVPIPFGMRVFGTMQSPGSMAIYLMAAILVSTSLAEVVCIPFVLVCTLALGLSQYRAIWGATCLALVLILLYGPLRQKSRIGMLAAILVLSASSLSVVPEMQTALTSRFQTLNELNSDSSGEERWGQYIKAIDDASIIGDGLGLSGVTSRLDGKEFALLDSGLLEALRSFGLVGAFLFLASLARLMVLTLRRSPTRTLLPIYRAFVIAHFVQLPFGVMYAGETGFIGWLFLGLALSELRIAQRPRLLPIGFAR